jgi:hypothetical protein
MFFIVPYDTNQLPTRLKTVAMLTQTLWSPCLKALSVVSEILNMWWTRILTGLLKAYITTKSD